jgi:uncharacterized protein YbaR (Trm112 family)
LINVLIYDAFKERSPQEAVDYLNTLSDKIINDGEKAGYEIKRDLYNYCLTLEVCPECGSNLKLHTEKQWSEAWGRPVSEDIGYLYCPECQWREES